MNNLRVCVIVPAYNEGLVIAKVVKKAKKSFSKNSDLAVDILVVNDGSKDNTSEAATGAGAIVIDHILNSGAGAATLTGLAYSRKHSYDIVATMDADGQHDPDDVLNGILMLQKSNVDLLIGSRLINSEGMSRVKVLGNKGLSLVTRILFGVAVTDSQSGLRILSRRAIDELDWKSTGFEFCSEMIWRTKQANMITDEYPIKAIYTDYSRAKGQNNWNAVNIIKRLFKQRIAGLFE